MAVLLHTPHVTGRENFPARFVKKERYIYMEEMIKGKIIIGYAGRPLQDIYNFINGIQMKNLITRKDAESLMSWAEEYKNSH